MAVRAVCHMPFRTIDSARAVAQLILPLSTFARWRLAITDAGRPALMYPWTGSSELKANVLYLSLLVLLQ